MEEKNEILQAMREGFARIDERFASIDRRFDGIDRRFDGIDQRFDGIDQRFVGIDQRFVGIDQRFDGVDQQFEGIDQRFDGVDQQFLNLRREFAEQLDGVSDGLHLELRAQTKMLLNRVESVRALVEKMDSKIALVGENVGNVKTELARYHAAVEAPIEARVTNLEARVWTLEQKKSGTAAERRRGSGKGPRPR